MILFFLSKSEHREVEYNKKPNVVKNMFDFGALQIINATSDSKVNSEGHSEVCLFVFLQNVHVFLCQRVNFVSRQKCTSEFTDTPHVPLQGVRRHTKHNES